MKIFFWQERGKAYEVEKVSRIQFTMSLYVLLRNLNIYQI